MTVPNLRKIADISIIMTSDQYGPLHESMCTLQTFNQPAHSCILSKATTGSADIWARFQFTLTCLGMINQLVHLHSLIQVFAERTCPNVPFLWCPPNKEISPSGINHRPILMYITQWHWKINTDNSYTNPNNKTCQTWNKDLKGHETAFFKNYRVCGQTIPIKQ